MDRKKKYDDRFIRKTIRFTPVEFEQIEKQREKTNLSFSEYVRSVSSKKKITTNTDMQLIYEINKIGNNLNQIAKSVNSNERIEVLSALLEIEKELKKL